jgi:predicted CopG family antitoxin
MSAFATLSDPEGTDKGGLRDPGPALEHLNALDDDTRNTHILCIMATKTISIRVAAYEKLRRAKTRPGESFSDVVMRARWDEQTVTGAEFLTQVRERGALYSSEGLDAIEEMKSESKPPKDKWSTP